MATDYYGEAASALAAYLADRAKSEEQERKYRYGAQNTKAGMEAGIRDEDRQARLDAAALGQQNPFAGFSSLQTQNNLTDLAQGQQVGPGFYGDTFDVPGVGSVPKLGMKFGSNYTTAQTPRNVASEYANYQARIKAADPYSTVTPMGELMPGTGNDLDARVEAAGRGSQERTTASRSRQSSAIDEAMKEGSTDWYDYILGGLGVASSGGKESLLAKLLGAGVGGGTPTSETDAIDSRINDAYDKMPYEDASAEGLDSYIPEDPWAKFDAANPGWAQPGTGLDPLDPSKVPDTGLYNTTGQPGLGAGGSGSTPYGGNSGFGYYDPTKPNPYQGYSNIGGVGGNFDPNDPNTWWEQYRR